MRKRHMIICGWCYANNKDALPMRILGGFEGKDRCAFCNRPVQYNAYVVEVGDEEDNERRPGNVKREIP